MSREDKLKWNEKYTQRLAERDQESDVALPNERLTLFYNYFQGNNAIDIACGLGANSLYLAKLGYLVQALDVSDIAIEYVNQLATQNGLSIEGKVTDLDTSSIPAEAFDLVISTFYLQRNLFKAMQDALRPDGYLFLETFYYVGENDPNPRMAEEYKLRSQELLHVFQDMKIIYYHENRETGLATLFAQQKN